VDVMEIEGFEISSELENQPITNMLQPEKHSLIKTQNSDLDPQKLVVKIEPTNNKPVFQSDRTVPATDVRITGRNNKNAVFQRSERVDDIEEKNRQEEGNVHKNESTTKSMSSDDESEMSDISSLVIEEDDSQEEDNETNKVMYIVTLKFTVLSAS
jgi:hypothetical protein